MKTVYHHKLFASIFHEVCLFCCYLYDYGTSKLEDNTKLRSEKSVHKYAFFAIPMYGVTVAKADIFLPAFLQMSEI